MGLVSLSAAHTYLNQLDLSYVVDAMCSESYPLPPWILSEAEQCAKLYKNFLWLNKKHLPKALVPTREIDEFWHNHILYTKNYVHDCMHIFGHYLHHEPTSPTGDKEQLIAHFLETKTLYSTEFHQPFGLIRKTHFQ